jgi:DNA/RNA endonuclease YhcR with UshA esterase domain
MNTKLRAALGAAVVALVAVAVLVARLDGGGPAGAWIPAAEASRHVGERGTVCGEVASTRYAPSANGEPTFLNLERPYPNQVFTALIWGEDRPRFGRAPEEHFRGRRICVTGKITEYRGTPQIVVRRPDQIEVVEEDDP